MIEHEVRRVVQARTTTNLPEDWDLDGIVKQFDAWGVPVPDDVFPEYINRLRRETLAKHLVEVAHAGFAHKEEEVVATVAKAADEGVKLEPGEFYMRQFERMVVLHVLDTLWQDHIDHLDVMRSGIGLRSMAQRDPLVEFKREAYQAFEQLKTDIEHQIVEYLFRVPVQIQVLEPPPESAVAKLRTNADAIAAASGQEKGAGAPPVPAPARPRQIPAAAGNGASRGQSGAGARPGGSKANGRQNAPRPVHGGHAKGGAAARAQTPQRAAVPAGSAAASSGAASKLGRNDPCYCGSGKKYKLCHGR